MVDSDYTKRELDSHFEGINGKLDLVIAQVQKTNGRVSSLENWKWFISGGLAILSILIVPILLKLL